ncbi:MAG: hypothetical protein ABMB14_34125 [Myxococcota bacterium]
MVTTPPALKVTEPVGTHIPYRPQPFEDLSVVVGIPGAILTGALSTGLVFTAMSGHALEGWGGIVALWTLYFGVMAAVWFAVADERGGR